MKRPLRTTAVMLLALLAACGPAPAAEPGTAAVEPQRASAAPTIPGPPTGETEETLHITWLYNEDMEAMVGQLGTLQSALNRGGWNVKLDILTLENQRKLGEFATDAFVTPQLSMLHDPVFHDEMGFADPQKLYDSGATVDVLPLCAKYAPVLAEKTAQFLTPSGIPLDNQRGMNRRSLYLMLLRNKAPQQWLTAPPAMTDILDWLEREGVSLGEPRPQEDQPILFQLALQAWAGSQGYCPLELYHVMGGFYAKATDPMLQPVPMENIPGFDGMYRRLFALYRAGKYSEYGPCPADTVGYLSGYEPLLDTAPERGIADMDMVALPIAGSAWEGFAAAQYTGRVLAIPSQSQHPQQVLELVQWLRTTREGYDLNAYGIKNEDYTLQNGRLQRTEDSKRSDFRFPLVWDYTMERQARLTNAADVERLTDYRKLPTLDAVSNMAQDANAKLIADRQNLLEGLLPGTGETVQPIANADAALEQLRALNADHAVDQLAQAYGAEMQKLVKK